MVKPVKLAIPVATAILMLAESCALLACTPTTDNTTPPIDRPAASTPEDYSKFLPPRLAKDFYPNGLTRDKLLARLPQAVNKTGTIEKDETWQGVIKISGDAVMWKCKEKLRWSGCLPVTAND